MAKGKKKQGKEKKAQARVKQELAALNALLDKYKGNDDGKTDAELRQELVELRKVVDRIVELQKAHAVASDESKEGDRFSNGPAFVEWLKEHAPNCGVGKSFDFVWDVSEGGGAVALKDYDEREQWISVPRKLIMSTETAEDSEVGKAFANDRLCKAMPNVLLAAHLAYELSNPNSFWKPYLDILPRKLTLPLFFSLDVLDQLQSSPMYFRVLKLQKATIRQYEHLQRLARMAGLRPLNFADYQLAVGLTMTRQNKVPSARVPGKSVLALIPGWDMCNYADGVITTGFDAASDSAVSFTMEPVKKGNQIKIYYGDRPNSLLFLYEGFVVSDLMSDVYQLSISVNPDDPDIKMKSLLFKKGSVKLTEEFDLPASGVIPRKLWMFARFAVVSKIEVAFALKNPEVEVLSSSNEKASVEYIRQSLQGILDSIPRDDPDKAAGSDTRLIQQLLASERRILRACLRTVEARWNELAEEGKRL